jgi:lipoprotein-releasing system permease protein
MFSKLEYTIAVRYLRSKRKESFISIVSLFSFIGIMLGVATLIVVMSVMKGFHTELLRNILGIQGHLTLINAYDKKFVHYDDLVHQIENIKGVKFVAPIIIGEGLGVAESKKSQGIIIRGIMPQDFIKKPMAKAAIDEEAFSQFQNGEGILMGRVLAQKLGLAIGDSIKIFIPENSSTILGMIPRSKSYKIIGVFDLGLYQYNSTTLFMTLSDAQNLFKYHNSVSEIEVITNDPENLKPVKDKIRTLIGPNISIVDWKNYHQHFLNSLAVERVVMFSILTLIIIVAAFNIISGLIMLVKDKTKNIAILKTMGMTNASIVRIFILSGSFIGVIGTLFGSIIGIGFALNIERIRVFLESFTGTNLFDPMIYYLAKLPTEVDFSSILTIVCMALFFSVIATIYPALRAARLAPTEVLKYE